MGTATFVLKKVETFPLVLELDCPLGKGKLTLDCRPRDRASQQSMVDAGVGVEALFDDVVAAVHGAPGEDGEELQGNAALEWFKSGPVSGYTMPNFRDAYWEQFGDARRKNGQRLPRR
jgi:hypothetical protein